jgi:hypothetical protein
VVTLNSVIHKERIRVENRDELERKLEWLRVRLDPVFGPDTSNTRVLGQVPSAGHCAAVAKIVHDMLGGMFVSAIVAGESHWFNRFQIGTEYLDVDLTGDQFDRTRIQVGTAGTLYAGTRLRGPEELNPETRKRAKMLAERAGLNACGG